MAFSSQTFSFEQVLTSAQMNQVDSNIDAVRTSHIGSSAPGDLTAGVEWVDNTADPYIRKWYDGADWISQGKYHIADDLFECFGKNVPRGWVSFNGTGTPAISDSFNVDSIDDDATGTWGVNWDIDFADTTYGVVATGGQSVDASNAEGIMVVSAGTAKAAGEVTIRSYRNTNTTGSALNDVPNITVVAYGVQ